MSLRLFTGVHPHVVVGLWEIGVLRVASIGGVVPVHIVVHLRSRKGDERSGREQAGGRTLVDTALNASHLLPQKFISADISAI